MPGNEKHHSIKRVTYIHFGIANEQLEKLEQKTQFKSISEAIRFYVDLGMLTENYKSAVQDPEFLKSIEHLKQGDKIFEWLSTLKDNELDGIFMAAKMEKEGRYVQAKFR